MIIRGELSDAAIAFVQTTNRDLPSGNLDVFEHLSGHRRAGGHYQTRPRRAMNGTVMSEGRHLGIEEISGPNPQRFPDVKALRTCLPSASICSVFVSQEFRPMTQTPTVARPVFDRLI